MWLGHIDQSWRTQNVGKIVSVLKKLNTDLPYDLTILPLDIYTQRNKIYIVSHQYTCGCFIWELLPVNKVNIIQNVLI